MTQIYSRFIEEHIDNIEAGAPFLTDEIAEKLITELGIEHDRAKKIVNTTLNRLNGNKIENFRRGVYYKPKVTVFGKVPLNPEKVITKLYMHNGKNIIGYETGASLIHKMGLTSQLPKFKYIATNIAGKQRGNKINSELRIVIRKPNIEVTTENFIYLQALDAIENKDGLLIDALNPHKIIYDFIQRNNLDFLKLIGLASKNYSKEVLYRLGKFAEKTGL